MYCRGIQELCLKKYYYHFNKETCQNEREKYTLGFKKSTFFYWQSMLKCFYTIGKNIKIFQLILNCIVNNLKYKKSHFSSLKKYKIKIQFHINNLGDATNYQYK